MTAQANGILRFCIVFLIFSPLAAQKLPEGQYHTNRERSYDIVHYKAELSFDFEHKRVLGKATVQLRPLCEIEAIVFDAIALDVTHVYKLKSNTKLNFEMEDGSLHIQLLTPIRAKDTLSVAIEYSATPKGGMYFVRNTENQNLFYVTTYGEDGLHANWLPIYADVNDRFSTEMVVTVPDPYVVVSNGRLLEIVQHSNGQKTCHWLQELPHPNYLISLYIGDFEKGELRPAFGSIPINYWVPRGRLQQGKYAFRNTTSMVEYFSEKFNYRYPWVKYDQIAVPDYAIGAMEHTTVTGHRESILRTENAPLDFNPTPEYYSDPWSAEALIAHELAHHWFGNLVTCRNLSYLWLNESFATYLMILWDEESVGPEQYLFSVDLAKKKYFDYVRTEHIIRPLEYHYFDDANTIYNTEHTYYKGALILHMLRRILGDEPFFRAIGYYLRKHKFSNVESNDLKTAIEETTGENLQWFFEQWITGGGHPRFEVSYDYLPVRKRVVLHVKQIQPLVEGQGVFELPVRITIATEDKTWQEKIWIESDRESFVIDCDKKPLMVSFDGEGDLVAEVDFSKNIDELAYQATHDAIPGRLWAIRQLAAHHPVSEKTTAIFEKIIAPDYFWGLQAEAAFQLGTIRTEAAQNLIDKALASNDYRVRKAAVLALPNFGTLSAIKRLENAVNNDVHDDITATALLALAQVNPSLSPAFITMQLERNSWYDEIRFAAMRACEQLQNNALLATIKKYASHKYNQFVYGAAIDAWAACAPNDKNLHRRLIALTEGPVYTLQQSAIAKLGDLYVDEAKQRLEEIIAENADANLIIAAEGALDKISLIER